MIHRTVHAGGASSQYSLTCYNSFHLRGACLGLAGPNFATHIRKVRVYNDHPHWIVHSDPVTRAAWREYDWYDIIDAIGSFNPSPRSTLAGAIMISCRFHDERTPSLRLWPNGGYYCHGCGARGDIPVFVAIVFGLSGPEELDAFLKSVKRGGNGRVIHPDQMTLQCE